MKRLALLFCVLELSFCGAEFSFHPGKQGLADSVCITTESLIVVSYRGDALLTHLVVTSGGCSFGLLREGLQFHSLEQLD